jgi:hypothetical protein
MGDGALRDSKGQADLHSKAVQALAVARRGVAAKDLSAAHEAASKVAQILGQ